MNDPQNKERFMCYMRGWRDGAAIRAMANRDNWRVDLRTAYDAGYGHGRDDYRRVSADVAGTYGYHPSVLRAEDQREVMT
jgi:hypothetical protein